MGVEHCEGSEGIPGDIPYDLLPTLNLNVLRDCKRSFTLRQKVGEFVEFGLLECGRQCFVGEYAYFRVF